MTAHPSRRDFLRISTAAGVAAVAGASGAAEDGAVSIIDTHLHLWDLSRLDLPWLKGAPEVIKRSFAPADFRQATEGLNVVRTVYMEVDVAPEQQVSEAEYVIGLCREPVSTVAGAVIGGSPQDEGFASYLKQFSSEPAVKGVRTVLHGGKPRGFCLAPRFVDSMKRLGDAGLSFDLCLRREEIADGAAVAAKCPETAFILDHCGNIGFEPRGSAAWRTWSDGIKAAADRPNVVCKISGVMDKAPGPDWTADDLAENVSFCLDAFGEDRVVFGGDWPVCLIGGTYRRWVEALRQVVADRSDAFRRKLFHDNAVKVYRLS